MLMTEMILGSLNRIPIRNRQFPAPAPETLFSSTVLAAIILGKTLPEALAWGGVNAMAVVQEIGAHTGLLSREKLEEYLQNAPEGYKAKKI